MFEAQLQSGSIFKDIVEAIKDLVTDCNLDVSEEEVSIQSMDSAHVSLVSVKLASTGFNEFRCDRSNTLGINTKNMASILKMLGDKDSITFKAEDEKPDSLTLMFENENSTSIADFDLKLMDIESEQLGIPDTPYKCKVQMNAKAFKKIISDLQVMGDTATISCGKEGIRFSVSGSIGSGNILLKANQESEKDSDHVVIDMEEPVELNFALRYLNFFTKATPLSDTVIISMSPDVPVVVEYPIEEDTGYVKYYLAPKIEED
mmetsp:Transcript_44981/g.109276  ORF Transcript_44981/g.109276 Transcript_44981/m.109276 type:complete len:261 (+) Transcript_44981:184-966(+)